MADLVGMTAQLEKLCLSFIHWRRSTSAASTRYPGTHEKSRQSAPFRGGSCQFFFLTESVPGALKSHSESFLYRIIIDSIVHQNDLIPIFNRRNHL